MKDLKDRIHAYLTQQGPQYGVMLEKEFGASLRVGVQKMGERGEVFSRLTKRPGSRHFCKVYSVTPTDFAVRAVKRIFIPTGFNAANPFNL